MARNLAASGLETRAWNRSIERAEPLADDGVEVARSAADAARGADAVITVVSDAEAVESVIADGPLEEMGDAVWIQASTVGIAGAERLAGLASERGVRFLDAPVIGTRQPAEEGKLIVLVGGDQDLIGFCAPVFGAIGSRTVNCGDVGAATRMKLVANAWVLSHVTALAETLALAEALEIDPRDFLDVIKGGPLDTPYAQLKGTAMIERSFHPPAFPLKHAHKDARLLLEAAAEAGFEPSILTEIRTLFAEAEQHDHGDEDMAAVFAALPPAAARA